MSLVIQKAASHSLSPRKRQLHIIFLTHQKQRKNKKLFFFNAILLTVEILSKTKPPILWFKF